MNTNLKYKYKLYIYGNGFLFLRWYESHKQVCIYSSIDMLQCYLVFLCIKKIISKKNLKYDLENINCAANNLDISLETKEARLQDFIYKS